MRESNGMKSRMLMVSAGGATGPAWDPSIWSA
jgi:hypothetical protein